MKYVIKCKDCVYGCDSMEDAARIFHEEWDDLTKAYEMEFADVGGGGLFWDVTEKLCIEFIELSERQPKEYPIEYAHGELQVPNLVRFHCQDRLADIEGNIEDEKKHERELVSDYHGSLGVHASWNR